MHWINLFLSSSIRAVAAIAIQQFEQQARAPYSRRRAAEGSRGIALYMRHRIASAGRYSVCVLRATVETDTIF